MEKWSKQKWIKDPLNIVKIKNPSGSFQTNPQPDTWWVAFFKKHVFMKQPIPHIYMADDGMVNLGIVIIQLVCIKCVPILVSIHSG